VIDTGPRLPHGVADGGLAGGEGRVAAQPLARGLHSYTFQLDVSAFVWDRGCI
jgi:hypothetical protein